MLPAQHKLSCSAIMSGFTEHQLCVSVHDRRRWFQASSGAETEFAKGGLKFQETYLFHYEAGRCCTYTVAQSSLHRQ